MQKWMNDIIEYWTTQGFTRIESYPYKIASGTLTPECFLGCFAENFKYLRIQDAVRPLDARPHHGFIHLPIFTQLQIFSSDPIDHIAKQLEDCLRKALPVEKLAFRFRSDTWDGRAIAATGVGEEVFLNGIEVAQINIIKEMGNVKRSDESASCLVAIGLDRLNLIVHFDQALNDINISDFGLIHHSDYFHTYSENLLYADHTHDSIRRVGLEQALDAELPIDDLSAYFGQLATFNNAIEELYLRGELTSDYRQHLLRKLRVKYEYIAKHSLKLGSKNVSLLLEAMIAGTKTPDHDEAIPSQLHKQDSRLDTPKYSQTQPELLKTFITSFSSYLTAEDIALLSEGDTIQTIKPSNTQLSSDAAYYFPTIKATYNEFVALIDYDLSTPYDQVQLKLMSQAVLGGTIKDKIDRLENHLSWLKDHLKKEKIKFNDFQNRDQLMTLFIENFFLIPRIFPKMFGDFGVLYLKQRHYGDLFLSRLRTFYNADKEIRLVDKQNGSNAVDALTEEWIACLLFDRLENAIYGIKYYGTPTSGDFFQVKRKIDTIFYCLKRLNVDVNDFVKILSYLAEKISIPDAFVYQYIKNRIVNLNSFANAK